jgi:hypothetical protein
LDVEAEADHVNRKVLFGVIFVLLLAVSAFLRLYQLGSIPHGITWDEAAIGYNGHAILTTRRDEWLVRLPVSFRSFGDYKAPLAIYVNGIFTSVAGLTSFGIRLPFALAGILATGAFSYLVWLVFGYSKQRLALSLLGLLFIALSPWHLHYSRTGFESGMALLFMLTGLIGFFRVERLLVRNRLSMQLVAFSLLMIAGFTASLYTYHSAKIAIPLLAVYLAIRYWKVVAGKAAYFAVVALAGAAVVYPLLTDSLFGQGAIRAGVLITSSGQPLGSVLAVLFDNYLQHFSPGYLLFGQADSLRHASGFLGVLTPVTLGLAVFGLLTVFLKRKEQPARNAAIYTSLVLIFVGLLPAALSSEMVPHSNRAFLALPGFLMLAIAGADYVLSAVSEKRMWASIVVGSAVCIEGLLFLAFWHHYTTEFAQKSSSAFSDGYLEAFQRAEAYRYGEAGKPAVGSIKFTDAYGQPYIYALLTTGISPQEYQWGGLNIYTFTQHFSDEDFKHPYTLLVTDGNTAFDDRQPDEVIGGSDGSERFRLYYTGEAQ